MTRPLARIMIADSYDIVRRGVRLLVEEQSYYRVVGEASNGRDALQLAKDTNPNVAILDFSLPELGGIELTYKMRRDCPQTEVLIYTDLNSDDLIAEALRAGAKGIVLKSESGNHLIAALDSLSLRRPYFSGRISDVLIDRVMQAKPEALGSCLSHREREVVQLVAEGCISKQVAHRLGISIKTIETHRASAMRKANLKTTADLVRFAIRNNIILA